MKTTRRNIFSQLKSAFKLGVFSSAILLPAFTMAQTGSPGSPLAISVGTSAVSSYVIDGIANEKEWASASAQPIAVQQTNICSDGCFSITGPADLSGTVKTFWRQGGLYVFFSVKDDILSMNEATFKEGVEMILDMDNSKANFFNDDDFQIGVGMDGIVNETKHFTVDYFTASILPVTGGYNVELFVDWATIDASYAPGNGKLVGIDFAINDTDGDGLKRSGKLAWYASDNNVYQYPNLAGTASLEGVDGTTSALSGFVASSKLYPNPSNQGQANIEFNMAAANNVKITLSDLVGKQIAVLAEANTNSLSTSFNTSAYPKGMYTVNYFIGGKAAGSKLFVIE